MNATIKIHSLKSVSRYAILVSLLINTGCATGLKCSSTSDVLSTLKLPAKTTRISKHYEAVYSFEATEITYDNPEYVAIPMAGATCRILIQAGKAVQAS